MFDRYSRLFFAIPVALASLCCAAQLAGCDDREGSSSNDESVQSASEALVAAPATCAPPAVLVCDGQPDGCRCRASTALTVPLPALDIAAGPAQTYLVKKDGTVWVWGKANDLGSPFGPFNPATEDKWEAQVLVPTQLPAAASTANPAVAIAAGQQGACALLNDGTVTCWGTFEDPANPRPPSTVVLAGPLVDGGQPPLRGVVSISRGARHACAITRSGDAVAKAAVMCWGDNSDGQLGNGKKISSATPVTVVDKTAVAGSAVQVVAAANTTCILYADGHVSCFGEGAGGQLGNGGAGAGNSSVTSKVTPVSPGAPDAPLAHIDAIYGGGAGSFCAHRPSTMGGVPEAVFCWGVNGASDGMGGAVNAVLDGSGSQANAPVDMRATTLTADGIVPRAIGWTNGCDWQLDGTAACWGSNEAHQLLDSTKTTQPRYLSPKAVYKIAIGSGHMCAITRNDVECWGEYRDGQLGNGSVNDPGGIWTLSDIPSVASSSCHPLYEIACPNPGTDGDCNCDVPAGMLRGQILNKWISLGREQGILGYLTSTEKVYPYGKGTYDWIETAEFSKDDAMILYQHSTGAHYVQGDIARELKALGIAYRFNGVILGSATGDPVSDGQVTYSPFVRGSIYATPTHHGVVVINPFQSVYDSQKSLFGYPRTDPAPVDASIDVSCWVGCSVTRTPSKDHFSQFYDNGEIFSGPKGTFWLGEQLRSLLDENGSPVVSGIGFPIENEWTRNGVHFAQTEDGGMLAWSPNTGAYRIQPDMMPAYGRLGVLSYGAPTGGETHAASSLDADAKVQHFEHGMIFSSNQGAFGVFQFQSKYVPCLGIATSGVFETEFFGTVMKQTFEHGYIYQEERSANPAVAICN